MLLRMIATNSTGGVLRNQNIIGIERDGNTKIKSYVWSTKFLRVKWRSNIEMTNVWGLLKKSWLCDKVTSQGFSDFELFWSPFFLVQRVSKHNKWDKSFDYKRNIVCKRTFGGCLADKHEIK